MKEKEHNPARAIGTFLIIFGLIMIAILLDVLNLGHPREYMMWQIILIVIGLFSLASRNLVGGIIMIAIGVYFLLPRLHYPLPDYINKVYWPAALVLLGLGFVISGVIKRNRIDKL